MATSFRSRNATQRAAVGPRRSLRSDPTLPRTLVDVMLTAESASQSAQRRPAEASRTRVALPIPRRLPRALRGEMPPNILYRRYPLVTSLLVELDELIGPAAPPPRRGR